MKKCLKPVLTIEDALVAQALDGPLGHSWRIETSAWPGAYPCGEAPVHGACPVGQGLGTRTTPYGKKTSNRTNIIASLLNAGLHNAGLHNAGLHNAGLLFYALFPTMRCITIP